MNKYDKIKTDFFNKEFEYNEWHDVSQISLATQEELKAFLKVVSPKKSDLIVELGSGDGRYVLPLLKKGYKILAIDYAKDAVKSLEKRAKKMGIEKNLTVLVEDFHTKRQTLQDKYDIGYLVSTFYMLAETEEVRLKIFNNFLDCIKPGGKVVILDPNPLNPLFYPYYWFHPKVTWSVEKNFIYSNRWNMKKILCRSGLKNIKIVPYGYLPGFTINVIPQIKNFNKLFSALPLLNYFSTFNFYYGEKKR